MLGHEPMGVVVEVGKSVTKLKAGRSGGGALHDLLRHLLVLQAASSIRCATTRIPTPRSRKMMGQAPAGLFGYSHMLGGIRGGQAEYLRVPYADVGPIMIPAGLPDKKVVFLSDIFPTGYMAAENAQIERGDTVAVWGCGRWPSFASAAPGCSVLAGSSPSTGFRNG